MLDPLGQVVDPVEGETQRLAHVAHGRTGPVGDHLGRHAGPLAPVFLVEILQHLLPPLMLEIDVDVGRLVALAAHEPFEEQIDPVRIDRRHAQAITDGRVGRRTSPLAEDIPAPCKTNQVPDREEVGLVVKLFDQVEFVFEQPADLGRDAVGVALFDAGPGETPKMLVRRLSSRCQLFRIFITKLIEREFDPIGDLERSTHGLRSVRKQRLHLCGGFQITLGIGKQVFSHLGHRAMVPHGRQNVLQRLPLCHVVANRTGGNQGNACRASGIRQLFESAAIVGAMVERRRQVAAVAEQVAVIAQIAAKPARDLHFGNDTGQQTIGMVGNICKTEQALTLLRPTPPFRDQPAETPIGGPVGGQKDNRCRILGNDLRPHKKLDPRLFRGRVSPNDAGQRIPIRNPDGPISQFRRPANQLLRMRSRLKKRKIRLGIDFSIGHRTKHHREAVVTSQPRVAQRTLGREPNSTHTAPRSLHLSLGSRSAPWDGNF